MRKLLVLLGLAAMAAQLSVTVASACADKLRVLGRGVRFQQAVTAQRTGSILIYFGQNTASATRDPQLQPALKQAGHKVRAVQGPAQLDEALKRGKYDVVLADIKDADTLEHAAQAAPSKPAVLPVVSEQDNSADAAKRFQRVLRPSDKTSQYLITIDELMQMRSKAAKGRL
jgi:hypothetical protein